MIRSHREILLLIAFLPPSGFLSLRPSGSVWMRPITSCTPSTSTSVMSIILPCRLGPCPDLPFLRDQRIFSAASSHYAFRLYHLPHLPFHDGAVRRKEGRPAGRIGYQQFLPVQCLEFHAPAGLFSLSAAVSPDFRHQEDRRLSRN